LKKAKKVVVIDDSAFMRRVVSDIIETDEHLKVVKTVSNGLEGLKSINEYRPDAIVLDINMPIMDGLEMLQHLRLQLDIPVLILSSSINKGTEDAIKALELDSIDFVLKPNNIFGVKHQVFIEAFINKLNLLLEDNNTKPNKETKTIMKNKGQNENSKIIALGCSTGGPKALHYIIPRLPKKISTSILIVQHMPSGFTKSLADRLNELSEIQVKEAEDGEIIQVGTAYIAKGGCHMKLIKHRNGQHMIQLTDDLPRDGHRPSVNVMLESLIHTEYEKVLGVILTGMGSDGTKGLIELKANKSVYVLAQDEESCVVYGMPKSAVDQGVVNEVIPLKNFPEVIINQVGVRHNGY
jgi:two-component system chemotaxis response regulator CheB